MTTFAPLRWYNTYNHYFVKEDANPMNDTELDARRTMAIEAVMQTKDVDLLDLVYKILVILLEEK